jgi:starvation-inducible DNA-binding protein
LLQVHNFQLNRFYLYKDSDYQFDTHYFPPYLCIREKNKSNQFKNKNIMRTLDYIKLDSAAAAKVVESLQQLLADYQVFYANLRGFHWNIKGHGFFVLHSKFEDLYNNAAEKVDELAERILMLGGVPKNKYSDYLKVSNIKEVEGVTNGDEALNNILETYSHFIVEERKLLAVASQAGDEATVAVMSDYLKEQEKMVWMLCAYASK